MTLPLRLPSGPRHPELPLGCISVDFQSKILPKGRVTRYECFKKSNQSRYEDPLNSFPGSCVSPFTISFVSLGGGTGPGNMSSRYSESFPVNRSRHSLGQTRDTDLRLRSYPLSLWDLPVLTSENTYGPFVKFLGFKKVTVHPHFRTIIIIRIMTFTLDENRFVRLLSVCMFV